MPTVYSHSALKSFRDCPRQFKFRYIEKPEIPKRIGAETYLGNAVHRVLQMLYQRGADGVEVPLEAALARYHEEWNKIDKTAVDVATEHLGVDDYIRNGEEMIRRHYERYRPFKQGILLGAELHLFASLPGTPYRLRGVVDRLWKRDDGTVEICDYKTGRHLARPTDEEFFYQMGIYQLAVMQNYPQYQNIEVAQYFLKLDEEVRLRLREDDLDKLTEDVRQVVLAIGHAERLNEFPPVETPLCRYCDYYKLCPAKRHEQMVHEDPDNPRAPQHQARQKASLYIEKHRQAKAFEAELDALKQDLIRLASELDVTKFVGAGGEVSLATKREEKFVTKTENPAEFAELTTLAKDLSADLYFRLDPAALMKDGYLKKRFPEEQMKQLEPFVRVRETTTVRVKSVKEEETE